jgi:hypothetical protein
MDGMKRIGWDERCEYDQCFDFKPWRFDLVMTVTVNLTDMKRANVFNKELLLRGMYWYYLKSNLNCNSPRDNILDSKIRFPCTPASILCFQSIRCVAHRESLENTLCLNMYRTSCSGKPVQVCCCIITRSRVQ